MPVRKFLPVVLLLFALCLPARASQTRRTDTRPRPAEDKLARHLSAAETYQLSGDLERAGQENRAIVAIALARLGAIAIRERQLQRAVELLGDSLAMRDDSDARTDMAIAYMRLREIERAITEAEAALKLNSKNSRAHHVLGKLLYMKGRYADAQPELERAIVLEPDLDAAYTLGMTYLRLKQIERAKLVFEEMQAALANSANAHLLFGRAYEETGFSAEAEREFKKALAIDDKTPRAHFYLGYVILQHGGSERLSQAREEFEREVQLDPRSVYSNFFLGVLAAAANDHSKAIRHLLETTRLSPQFGEAYLFLGQSQAELGDANAEKSLRRAIELTTDVSHNGYQIKKAHFNLGRILLKAGRRAEAEKHLDIAKDLQGKSLESSRQELSEVLGQVARSTNELTAPSQIAGTISNRSEEGKENGGGSSEAVLLIEESSLDAEQAARHKKLKEMLTEILAQAFHNLGVSAAQQSQFAVSLEQFAKAAQWKADLAGLDRNWGIVSFRAEQYETAIPALSRHVKVHPDDALPRRMLGVSYYLTQAYPRVVDTLKPLGPKITTDPELAYIYGVSLVQLAEHKQAGSLFESLSAQNPKSAQTHFYAAQGFAMLENFERAIKEFRSAADLDPKMQQVHYHAGQSLIRLNRLGEAEREFRAELLLNPADVVAKYHLAYVLLEQKQQIPNALTLLREAVAARPDYADAQYQLGKALIDMGEVSQAIEHLEIAARAEPSKDYIHYQLSIAYRRASREADADRELELYKSLKASKRKRELPVNMGAKPQ
ncbi:MAG TPA: tetratricopeptide repeat protein [Pyrinomonadaceae bacterium]|nr:tetratricopeptide repeat protein [Pyrinomonadaceae bacterium]